MNFLCVYVCYTFGVYVCYTLGVYVCYTLGVYVCYTVGAYVCYTLGGLYHCELLFQIFKLTFRCTNHVLCVIYQIFNTVHTYHIVYITFYGNMYIFLSICSK